jgi:hypothetical protein
VGNENLSKGVRFMEISVTVIRGRKNINLFFENSCDFYLGQQMYYKSLNKLAI